MLFIKRALYAACCILFIVTNPYGIPSIRRFVGKAAKAKSYNSICNLSALNLMKSYWILCTFARGYIKLPSGICEIPSRRKLI